MARVMTGKTAGRKGRYDGRNERASRHAPGRIVAAKPYSASRPLHFGDYWAAVVLFAMLTTCTRRFTSAVGWLGSLSLVLPYPTVTRSVPAMPNLSVR